MYVSYTSKFSFNLPLSCLSVYALDLFLLALSWHYLVPASSSFTLLVLSSSGWDTNLRKATYLRQTELPRIRALTRPGNLEHRDQREGKVMRPIVRPVGTKAHVDVHECCGVALKPTCANVNERSQSKGEERE